MRTYSIVAEAKNYIIVDEIEAKSSEEAIAMLKRKHKVWELKTCVVSAIKEAA